MATTYELWDLDTRNLLAVFDNEEAALAAIRADLHTHGRAAVENLLLGRVEEGGGGGEIAAGEELIVRARAATPARRRGRAGDYAIAAAALRAAPCQDCGQPSLVRAHAKRRATG